MMGEKVQENYAARPRESLATSTGTDRQSAHLGLVLGSLATPSAFGRGKKIKRGRVRASGTSIKYQYVARRQE